MSRLLASLESRRKAIFVVAAIAAITICVLLAGMLQAGNVKYELLPLREKDGLKTIALVTLEQQRYPADNVLIVYLHGLGQTNKEPLEFPSKRHSYALAASRAQPGAILASLDYGRAGVWFNSSDLNDITDGIEYLMKTYRFSKIILAGSSMGGCAALTYASIAPYKVREMIAGVVAVYASGDLIELYRTTNSPIVTLAMERGLGGKPDATKSEYLGASLMPHLSGFPPAARVYVISASGDTVVPTALQRQLVSALSKACAGTRIETIAGTHFNPPPEQSFTRGIAFVLGR